MKFCGGSPGLEPGGRQFESVHPNFPVCYMCAGETGVRLIRQSHQIVSLDDVGSIPTLLT